MRQYINRTTSKTTFIFTVMLMGFIGALFWTSYVQSSPSEGNNGKLQIQKLSGSIKEIHLHHSAMREVIQKDGSVILEIFPVSEVNTKETLPVKSDSQCKKVIDIPNQNHYCTEVLCTDLCYEKTNEDGTKFCQCGH